jgi:hypothetical protein
MKVRSTAFIYEGFVERPSNTNFTGLEAVGCDGHHEFAAAQRQCVIIMQTILFVMHDTAQPDKSKLM